jgi:hypothetical protein
LLAKVSSSFVVVSLKVLGGFQWFERGSDTIFMREAVNFSERLLPGKSDDVNENDPS